eukprot:gene8125-5660_t
MKSCSSVSHTEEKRQNTIYIYIRAFRKEVKERSRVGHPLAYSIHFFLLHSLIYYCHVVNAIYSFVCSFVCLFVCFILSLPKLRILLLFHSTVALLLSNRKGTYIYYYHFISVLFTQQQQKIKLIYALSVVGHSVQNVRSRRSSVHHTNNTTHRHTTASTVLHLYPLRGDRARFIKLSLVAAIVPASVKVNPGRMPATHSFALSATTGSDEAQERPGTALAVPQHIKVKKLSTRDSNVPAVARSKKPKKNLPNAVVESIKKTKRKGKGDRLSLLTDDCYGSGEGKGGGEAVEAFVAPRGEPPPQQQQQLAAVTRQRGPSERRQNRSPSREGRLSSWTQESKQLAGAAVLLAAVVGGVGLWCGARCLALRSGVFDSPGSVSAAAVPFYPSMSFSFPLPSCFATFLSLLSWSFLGSVCTIAVFALCLVLFVALAAAVFLFLLRLTGSTTSTLHSVLSRVVSVITHKKKEAKKKKNKREQQHRTTRGTLLVEASNSDCSTDKAQRKKYKQKSENFEFVTGGPDQKNTGEAPAIKDEDETRKKQRKKVIQAVRKNAKSAASPSHSPAVESRRLALSYPHRSRDTLITSYRALFREAIAPIAAQEKQKIDIENQIRRGIEKKKQQRHHRRAQRASRRPHQSQGRERSSTSTSCSSSSEAYLGVTPPSRSSAFALHDAEEDSGFFSAEQHYGSEWIDPSRLDAFVDKDWIALEGYLHEQLPDYHYVKGSYWTPLRQYQQPIPPQQFASSTCVDEEDAKPSVSSRSTSSGRSSAYCVDKNESEAFTYDRFSSAPAPLRYLDLFFHEVEYAYTYDSSTFLDPDPRRQPEKSSRRTRVAPIALMPQQRPPPTPVSGRTSKSTAAPAPSTSTPMGRRSSAGVSRLPLSIATPTAGGGAAGPVTRASNRRAAEAPSSPTTRRRKATFATSGEWPAPSTPLAGTTSASRHAQSSSMGANSTFHRTTSSMGWGEGSIRRSPPPQTLHQPSAAISMTTQTPSKVAAVPVSSQVSGRNADAPRSMPAAQPSTRTFHADPEQLSIPSPSTAAGSQQRVVGRTTVHQSTVAPSMAIPSPHPQRRITPLPDHPHPKQLQLEIIENLKDAAYGLDDDDDDSKSANSSVNSSYCGSPRSPGRPAAMRLPRPSGSHFAEDDEPFVYNARAEENAVNQFFSHGSIIFEDKELNDDDDDQFRPPPAPRRSGGGLLAPTASTTTPPASIAAAADSSKDGPPSTATVIPPLPDLNGDRKARDTVIRQIISRASYLGGESPAESTGQRMMAADRDALGGVLLPSPVAGSALIPGHSRSSSRTMIKSEAVAVPGNGEAGNFQCRSLSLYEAFFLDRSKKKWLVDDMVLAKCFEYVGLMGYEHPQYRRDRAKCQPSIWSTSASISSPLIQVASRTAGVSTTASAKNDVCIDGVLRRYRLSHKPSCQAERTGVNTIFMAYEEAMRWVLAKEYVIGAILLVCASSPSKGGEESSLEPCIPPNTHPIFWVAQHIHTFYPQWGDFQTFSTLWETQVRLVLTPASPSRQRSFRLHEEGLFFSSDREGGNLARVEKAPDQPGMFYLWLEPDLNSDKRIWFRFSVSGAVEGKMLRFKLLNAAPHLKLYRSNGMMPVWRDGVSRPHWGPVDQCGFRLTNNDLDGELTFAILPRNSTETIQIAFCAPYTYADLLCHLVHWHCLVEQNPAAKIRFEERVLGYSPEGRKQHVLIITSPTAAVCRRTIVNNPGVISAGSANASFAARRSVHIDPNAKFPTDGSDNVKSPYSNFSTGKKVVLISGRVHPGEITASHGLHGLVTYLLSGDPGAARLRDHFIFVVVPMLNPDGVSRGHSRMDQWGVNLNRSYNNPDPVAEPTIYQLKKLFEGLLRTHRERFFMYIDFHSHASQSTSFMFGNHLPDEVHHWNKAFPRLVELHSQNLFSYSVCRFGRSHMSSKDGASRVLFGTSLIHSYTIELPHFTDRCMYTERLSGMVTGNFGLEGGPGTMMSEQGAGTDVGAFGMAFLNNLPPDSAATAAVLLSARHQKKMVQEKAEKSAKAKSSTKPMTSSRGANKKSGEKSVRTVNQPALSDQPQPQPPPLPLHSSSARQRRRAMWVVVVVVPPGSGSRHRKGLVSADTEQLQPIFMPSVLRQSAIVGVACMKALLDYASLHEGNKAGASLTLTQFGGMARILAVVKKNRGAKKKKKAKKA